MAQTTSRDKQVLLTKFLSRISHRQNIGELFDQVVESVSGAVLVNRSKTITDAHTLAVICNILRKKKQASPSVKKWLKNLLRHGNLKVKSYAAEALGDLRVRSAAPELHQLFQDKTHPVYVRDNCAMALGLLHYHKAVRDLEKELDSRNRTIRLTAAFALGNIGLESARRPLKARLVIEQDHSVKDAIVAALAKLTGK